MNTTLICNSCGSTLNDKIFKYQAKFGTNIKKNKKFFALSNVKRNCCKVLIMTATIDKKFVNYYKTI